MTPHTHTHTSERRKPGPAPRTDEKAPAGTINVRLRRIDRDRLDALMADGRAALVAAGLSPDLQTEADIVRRLIERAAAASTTSTASTTSAVVVATATGSTGAAPAGDGADDDALREATTKWCEADGKGANNRLAKLIGCRPEQLSRWKSGTGALSPERRDALAGIVGGAVKRKARRA